MGFGKGKQMTPEQKVIVQSSFQRVRPVASLAATLFYTRLFKLHPHLRHKFNGNMNEQGRKLMDMLGLAVSNLDNPEVLVPMIRELGCRHVRYGVLTVDYAALEENLLWTLEYCLGREHFGLEVSTAWKAAYTLLSSEMQKASSEECYESALEVA